MPKIEGPAAGNLSQSEEQAIRGHVRRVVPGRFFHLVPDRGLRFHRRVGVDQNPDASFLLMPLDVESQKVEALVNINDLGLIRGQPQPHLVQDVLNLNPQTVRMSPFTVDHDNEVIGLCRGPGYADVGVGSAGQGGGQRPVIGIILWCLRGVCLSGVISVPPGRR